MGVWRVRRTDSSGLDHVADGESLDGLVLRNASRAVGAADGLDVATTLLVATAVQKMSARHSALSQTSQIVLGSSLLDHFDSLCEKTNKAVWIPSDATSDFANVKCVGKLGPCRTRTGQPALASIDRSQMGLLSSQ